MIYALRICKFFLNFRMFNFHSAQFGREKGEVVLHYLPQTLNNVELVRPWIINILPSNGICVNGLSLYHMRAL